MRILLASPVVLSCLLMAAHFLRGGHAALVALCLALPFLLLARRPWVPWVLAIALTLGSLEWAHTAITLAEQRMSLGEPWLRMVAILGTVTLFTGASALAPFSTTFAGRFRKARAEGSCFPEQAP